MHILLVFINPVLSDSNSIMQLFKILQTFALALLLYYQGWKRGFFEIWSWILFIKE